MTASLAIFVASLTLLAQPEPVIPIPTGQAGDAGPYFAIVAAGSGLRTEAGYLEPDGLKQFYPSHIQSWRAESRDLNDLSRIRILKPLRGLIPQRIVHYDLYLGNSFSMTAELAASVRSRCAKVELQWFPIEGVMFSIGFDLLGTDLLSGLRLQF